MFQSDFGIHIGNDLNDERISNEDVVKGFTRTISKDKGITFKMRTQYGVNHPLVWAIVLSEGDVGKVVVQSPREDGLPHSIVSSIGGTFRFQVHAPSYVECTTASTR
jgi:hypothetical protein